MVFNNKILDLAWRGSLRGRTDLLAAGRGRTRNTSKVKLR